MFLFLDIRSKINLDRMGKVNVLVAAVSEINKPIFLRLRTTEIKWRDANGHERIHDTSNTIPHEEPVSRQHWRFPALNDKTSENVCTCCSQSGK